MVVLTPLVDPRSADMLARLTQSGRYTVAVDTLPAGSAPPQRSQWTAAGHPAVADRTRERAGPAARARRTGGDLGRGRQPRPGAARRRPDGLGAEGALTCWSRSPDGSSRARVAIRRATLVPLLVRFGIALSFVLAMSVAWPRRRGGQPLLLPLFLVAVWPAFAPRGRGVTAAILVVVAGWMADTSYNDNAGGALAGARHRHADLPGAHPGRAGRAAAVPTRWSTWTSRSRWLARAGAVVLISAVLTVVALGITDELAGAGVRGRHPGRAGRRGGRDAAAASRLLRRT